VSLGTHVKTDFDCKYKHAQKSTVKGKTRSRSNF
jgi:hypothetical protein